MKHRFIKLNLCFITVLLWTFVSFSKECKTLNELKWPDELIYFYFNQPGLKIIPIPSAFCLIQNQIEIKDLSGNAIGKFKIKSSILGRYNDYTLKSKKTSKIILKYHKTIALYSNPYLFTDFIFNLLNIKLVEDYRSEIQFLYGNLEGLKKPIEFDPYKFSPNHWNARKINYDQLIQFYAKNDVEFINFSDEDGYFFPKAIPYTNYLSKYIKSDLLNLVFESNLKAQRSNKEIVIYSTYKNTLKAYNLISKLYAKNEKKIFWFNNADTQWINSKSKDLNTVFKKVKIATTDAFISDLKANTKHKILDISDPEAFEIINFKNSVALNPPRLSDLEYKAYYLKTNSLEAYNKLSESTRKSGDFIFYGLSTIPNDTKLFIVGHHLLAPLRANEITKSLSRLGYLDVNIVLETPNEILRIMKAMRLNTSDYIYEKAVSLKSLGAF